MKLLTLLVPAVLLATPLAEAASHPYFEFARHFLQGQANVRVAVWTKDGQVVYTAVLLKNEPEAIVIWSPNWRDRLTIPQSKWPLMESVQELDGLRVGDAAACDQGEGTLVRRGRILSIDRNPMRALYQVEGEWGPEFLPRCGRP